MAGATSFEILPTRVFVNRHKAHNQDVMFIGCGCVPHLPNGRYIGIRTVVHQTLKLSCPLPLISQRNNPVDAMISLFITIYNHLKPFKTGKGHNCRNKPWAVSIPSKNGRFRILNPRFFMFFLVEQFKTTSQKLQCGPPPLVTWFINPNNYSFLYTIVSSYKL